MPTAVETRPIGAADRAAVDALAVRHWGETRVANVSGVVDSAALPGAAALLDGRFAGAVTWAAEGGALRIVTIASEVAGRGVGRALLAAAEAEGRARGAARIVVSTTNDNLNALGFYQRAGYVLAALHAGAIAGLRTMKPGIPEVAANGIPIRDQIDLEKRLTPASGA
jgi:ribosomal protein S18 acetylase RimI-like enzyme